MSIFDGRTYVSIQEFNHWVNRTKDLEARLEALQNHLNLKVVLNEKYRVERGGLK